MTTMMRLLDQPPVIFCKSRHAGRAERSGWRPVGSGSVVNAAMELRPQVWRRTGPAVAFARWFFILFTPNRRRCCAQHAERTTDQRKGARSSHWPEKHNVFRLTLSGPRTTNYKPILTTLTSATSAKQVRGSQKPTNILQKVRGFFGPYELI